MSPISMESAITRLYDNEGLTDELDDQPAKLLLQWAESQLALMVNRHTNEEAFEDAFKSLRLLVRSMNRFAARRDSMAADEQRNYVQRRIIERAQAMGFTTQAARVESLESWVQSQQAADQLRCVQATIKLVEGESGSGGTKQAF